jgi:hypothetical protein
MNSHLRGETYMVKRVRVLFALGACMALLGCSTLPSANPSGKTLIESDPPGARIEINSQYVGTTPLRVNIPRLDSNWSTISVTIIASPINPGQQVQTKYIASNESTPTHVFFDMNLVRSNN